MIPTATTGNSSLCIVLGNSIQAKQITQVLSLSLSLTIKNQLIKTSTQAKLTDSPIELLLLPFDERCSYPSLGQDSQVKHTAVYDVPCDEQALLLMQQGINGIFYINDPLDTIVRGCRLIINGELWYKRSLTSRFINQRFPATQPKGPVEHWSALQANFSRRELEVLALLAQCMTNDEIAITLFISPHTVKSHVSRIFKKLNVQSRAEAAAWGANRQLFLANYIA